MQGTQTATHLYRAAGRCSTVRAQALYLLTHGALQRPAQTDVLQVVGAQQNLCCTAANTRDTRNQARAIRDT